MDKTVDHSESNDKCGSMDDRHELDRDWRLFRSSLTCPRCGLGEDFTARWASNWPRPEKSWTIWFEPCKHKIKQPVK